MYYYGNVNSAFRSLVRKLNEGTEIGVIETDSRNGPVRQAAAPVLVAYGRPNERVLFNQARDCNPFFHLMESLWMLAGKDDVVSLKFYNSKIADYSDDGVCFNGAYGFRWRNGVSGTRPAGNTRHIDQLEILAAQLKCKPGSRRCVLTMWNVQDDLVKIDDSKDVCCNTHAYFQVVNDKLDMTVCNRSNDLIWGMLGANVVHFSFLQEYMAAKIGVPMGVYYHFTNNMHAYVNNWKPQEWLADTTPDYYEESLRLIPLVRDPVEFDSDLNEFVANWLGKDLSNHTFVPRFKEPFFRHVAQPAAIAYHYYKLKDYISALRWTDGIVSSDWQIACRNWLVKRKLKWEDRDLESARAELRGDMPASAE